MTTAPKTASKPGKLLDAQDTAAEVRSGAAASEAQAKRSASKAKAKKPKSKAAMRQAAGKKSR